MNQLANKKEMFKVLIKEFHEEEPPETVERELEIPLDCKKIITVFGPRRSGKSFYFYGCMEKILKTGAAKNRIVYVNFEDDRLLPLHFKELNELTEAYFELYPDNKNREVFFFFDEIQNIENWELFVRRLYDKEKARIFITGSSSKLLSREIATGLRGRTLSYGLSPLNFREFLRFKGETPAKNFQYTRQRYAIKKLLDEYLEFGGFPEVVLAGNINIKNKILKEYFDLLVYRDLIERFSVKNTELLKEILRYFFTNITSLFSVNAYHKSIRQALPSSRDTIYEYLGYIKETEYFHFLPFFSYSLKSQKANPAKIISLDNGLRNRIAFKFSKDLGKLAENLVGSILAREESSLFYWRDKREVDFIRQNDNRLEAINVSIGPIIEKREVESLLECAKHFQKVSRLVLITKDVEKRESKIEFVPLYKWLLKEI